ncbi:MAG: hypothetical protein L3J29_09730 [Cyclobacteriaceae bacterium]|nr:hypothetical protein [Cyclobacteriaceae bacterium]
MKKIFFLAAIALPILANGQSYYKEAIRFSNTAPLGSARIQSLGGASVALGADPSAILTNPAGLGLYNSWEVALTPAINITNTKASLNNNTTSTTGTKFSLDQISLVLSNPNRAETDVWFGGSWGFGVQKINDFNSKFVYDGVNTDNSLIDYFIENADGIPANDFPNMEDAFDLTSLAYYNYLIGPWNVTDVNAPDDEYFSDVTSFVRPSLRQTETIETSGSQYQITLGYGGNFGDVFYFGFNLGLVTLDYQSTKSYTEYDFDYTQYDSTYHPLNSFNATENLSINGTGVNLNFGIIIRPMPSFRIGASITTRTVYNLNDSYETTMGAEWDNFYYEDLIGGDTLLNSTYVESAIIESIYTLETPVKYALGGAAFLGKLGFITVDAEFINYGKASLDAQEFSMSDENEYITTNFGNQVNLKAGIEIRLSPLRLRAGYAINGAPTDKQDNLKIKRQNFSGGAGILLDQFYADFALVFVDRNTQYSPYLLSDYSEPVIDISANTIRSVFTFGYKF